MSPPFQPAPCARAPFLNDLLAYTHGDGWEARPHVGDHLDVYERGWDRALVLGIEAGRPVVEVTDGGESRRVHLGPDDYFQIVASPTAEAIWETHLKRARPDGVALADGLVEDGLQQRLADLFDTLCAAGPPDYHPGSGTAVRDLVHPSLYAYLRDHTPLQPGVKPPPHPEVGHPPVDRWGRPFEASRFQWLPTDVQVDPTGAVHFEGPLHNLDVAAAPDGPATLADLLATALPLLESVYGYAQAFDPWDHRADDCEADLPEPPAQQPPPVPVAPVSLRGRRLQVIPKLVEYTVGPDAPHDSVWHVEGMSHEHIVATALYVLHRDPHLAGGTLRFKRGYTREEAGQVFWNIAQCRPTPVDEMVGQAMLPLGSVDTPQGRLVGFPNSHVHKLTPLSSTTGAPATRRIVVFWLVDPEKRILSTSDVVPPHTTVPLERALEHRLALMEERKRHKQSHNVREISLCEH